MNTLPHNADGTITAICLTVGIIAALVIVAVLAHAWLKDRRAPAAPPAKPVVHRCHGAHCWFRAYFRDWHIADQKWVWSCSGCHHRGHYMGWLTYSPDHAEAASL